MPLRVRARRRLAVALTAVVVAASAAGAHAAPGERHDMPRPAQQRAVKPTTDLPRATPRSQGFKGRQLRKAARSARQANSSCFVVVRHGKVVGEWNWGVGADFPRMTFSTTKSVTSALVGIALRDGDLKLSDKVSDYVPQWRGTPSEAVTIRHLLSNTSGRFWSFQSDYTDLVRAPSRIDYAVGLSQQFAPGTSWQYNNAAIQVLEPVLEQATGMPVAQFAKQRLFKPLGMKHSYLVTDRTDDAENLFGLRTTCLDMARFGLLYLGHGTSNGERLLSRSFVTQSVARSSSTHNAAYGLLWWINRPGTIRGATDALDPSGQPSQPQRGRLIPGEPSRLFAAVGLGGQVMLADPGTQTLVIRQGSFASPGEQAYSLADAAAVLPSRR